MKRFFELFNFFGTISKEDIVRHAEIAAAEYTKIRASIDKCNEVQFDPLTKMIDLFETKHGFVVKEETKELREFLNQRFKHKYA